MKDAFTTHVDAIVVVTANVFVLQLLHTERLALNLVSLFAGGRKSIAQCNVTMEKFINRVVILANHLVDI